MSPGSVLPAVVLRRFFPLSVEMMIRKEATKDGGPGLPLPLENCEGQRCAELTSWEELDTGIETMIHLVLFCLVLVDRPIHCWWDGVGLHCVSEVKPLVLRCL